MPGIVCMVDMPLMSVWRLRYGAAGGEVVGAAGGPVLLHGVAGAEVADGFEIAAPGLGPRQAGEEQKESEEGDVDAGDGVDVFPEGAASGGRRG